MAVGRGILYCMHELGVVVKIIMRYYEGKGIDKQGVQAILP